MTDRFFVDTNLLVYSRDTSEHEKQQKAMKWMTRLWHDKSGRVSYQVLQEFYITVTHKLDPGLPIHIARMDVRSLMSWQPVSSSDSVLERAWAIQDRYGLSWWDALIVSAAQIAECKYLLTEDLQENQHLGAIKVLNPFQADPDTLLS
jgi:predicted nucleic acid-binding protein